MMQRPLGNTHIVLVQSQFQSRLLGLVRLGSWDLHSAHPVGRLGLEACLGLELAPLDLVHYHYGPSRYDHQDLFNKV